MVAFGVPGARQVPRPSLGRIVLDGDGSNVSSDAGGESRPV
jgi:hypothetical protein